MLLAAVGVMGCGVDSAQVDNRGGDVASTSEDGAELSSTSRTYVTLRRDIRKCIAPMCGGYFVADVNRVTFSEKYVNALDFSKSDLSADDIAVVLGAPEGELVLRGKLGPAEARFNTRPFQVYEAYRGMPGVTATDKTFFTVEDTGIRCVRAPCPTFKAKKLNSTATRMVDGVWVTSASLALVDETWLAQTVLETQAIVSAQIVEIPSAFGDDAVMVDASQVFLRVPQNQSCPQARPAQCAAGTERTWSRREDRCLVPSACVAKSPDCPRASSIPCASGYTRLKWAAEPDACTEVVCDPSWLFSGH